MSKPYDAGRDADGYDLVFPFVVCRSNGGPYDDDAFVAGYQAGQIYQALGVAAQIGVRSARYTVRTALVPQLELIGMDRGFPVVKAEPWDEHPDEWTFVTFSAEDESDEEASGR